MQASESNRCIRVLSRMGAEQRIPLQGEVCISIANPSQSKAKLEGYADILYLGFHDTDRKGGNFVTMAHQDAVAVLDFIAAHKEAPLLVHCQFGASRSVAIGLFISAWLDRPIFIAESDVLMPNLWVINRLRAAAVFRAIKTLDARLFACTSVAQLKRLSKNNW